MQTDPLAEAYAAEDPARRYRPKSIVRHIKDIDASRPDFPGEHLIVFGAGVLLMLAGMRSRTIWRGALLTAAGTALVGRAASGTGGIARLARVVKRLG